MELQTIFKLFYVLQVNLDIFLQKKQNGTGYLCIQANFLVGKKKTTEIFQKFYIDFFHPCLKNYEDMFIRETSVM